MAMPAVPTWDSNDLTYGADIPKEIEVSKNSVDNLLSDGWLSVLKVSLVETEVECEYLLACGDGNGNKVALRHVLKRCKAGDLRHEVPASDGPPAKKLKKLKKSVKVAVDPSGSVTTGQASGSEPPSGASGSKTSSWAAASSAPIDDDKTDNETPGGQDDEEPAFEKTKVCPVVLR
jgi:hypothetical protein